MERDLFSFADRAPFEYVLGSVHYLPLPDGKMVPVDGPMDMVQEAIMDHFEGTACAMPRPITRCLAPTSSEYQPDIIGHFDLLMKNNRQQELIDPENPQYIKAATDAMDEAITGCNLLEINTGGMARHGAPDPTPCPACCAIGARSAGGDPGCRLPPGGANCLWL